MGKSRQLRLSDVREIYRLVGECRERGMDTNAWLGHALDRLRRLIGAQLAIGGENHPAAPDRAPKMISTLAIGWPSVDSPEYFARLMEYGRSHSEPLFHLFAPPPPDGRQVTRSRISLISNTQWYASVVYNEYVKRAELDDTMLSHHRLQSGEIHTIGFCRTAGESHFGWRERRLVHLLHLELGPQIGKGLARAGEASVAGLAPRLLRTLECLLEGDSEKMVAARLGLSRSTVHEYVTLLHAHFGVSSRGELMALFLRRFRGQG
jgi:DNA-binding CsgD family transcriptional regulator